MQIRCPHCGTPTQVGDRDLTVEQTCASCGSRFSLVSASQAPTVKAPLQQRLAHFELLSQIGVGAFGSVWKARDTKLDRLVAVKIPREVHSAPTDAEKFLREARAAAQLRHPNIVSVHEAGRDNGTVYIVSDLVDGLPLSDWLSGQQPTVRQAAELCVRLADALHYAHEQGVVHRDVKPANILLDVEGQPHVMDFGLAKRNAGEVTMTVEGKILGTPAYMSPEQAKGEGHHADCRSDVYSLGVILFQLLTSELPFRGTARMLLYQVLHEEPKSPRTLNNRVPKDLETICLKCLDKDPDKRYQTAAELSDDLRRHLDGKPISARPIGRIERAWRWARRHPAAAAALLLLVVMVIGSTAAAAIVANTLRAQRTADRQRTFAQIDALIGARPTDVPKILQSLEPDRDVAVPRFKELIDDVPLERRWRLNLGLLPTDPAQANELNSAMLTVDIEELLVIHNALGSQGIDTAAFREVLNQTRNGARRRFNAACVLANLQPEDAANQWSSHATFISDALIGQLLQSPSRYPVLLQTLRPVGRILLEPLAVICRDDSKPESQHYATTLVAEYAAQEPQLLSELIQDANGERFEVLCSRLERLGEQAVPSLEAFLQQDPGETEELSDKNAAALRRSNVAVALLRLGQAASVLPLLENTRDPTFRTYLINQVAALDVDPTFVWESIQTEPNVSVRRALLVILGAYDERQLPREQRLSLVPALVSLYRNDPDPGIHGAAEWVLRQWDQVDRVLEIDSGVATRQPEPDRGWYVNAEGQTMMLVPDGSSASVTLGFRPKYRVGHSFWIASKAVTVAEFLRFDESHPIEGELAPSPQCPVHGPSWFQAAAYCNWLSERNGIPQEQWCFLPNEEGEYAPGMRLADDYVERDGYRLPTDPEWDYAYRAGAITQFSFGDDIEVLGAYAWCSINAEDRTWPVGLLRPNDFGLFDMHGNLWEWTASVRLRSQSRLPREVDEEDEPIVYGGTFRSSDYMLRPSERRTGEPQTYDREHGFRVVRTAR